MYLQQYWYLVVYRIYGSRTRYTAGSQQVLHCRYPVNSDRVLLDFRSSQKNEISGTSGYEFKPKAPIEAKSGKRTYDLFSKGKFAWVVDNEDEKKLIITMKKASRLMIIGN